MQAASSLDCLCTGSQQAPQAKGLMTVYLNIKLPAPGQCNPSTTVSWTAFKAGAGLAALVSAQWLLDSPASAVAGDLEAPHSHLQGDHDLLHV